MCACAYSSVPGWAGRPPGRVLVHLTFPVDALLFCFARPLLGWDCPFLLVLLPYFVFFPLCLRAPAVSCLLLFRAPGVLGLGAGCFLLPPDPLFCFFLFRPAWVGVCFLAPSFSSDPPPLFFFVSVLVFLAACLVLCLFPLALLFLSPPLFPPFFLFFYGPLGFMSASCRPFFCLPPPLPFFSSWFSSPPAWFGVCFLWPSFSSVSPRPPPVRAFRLVPSGVTALCCRSVWCFAVPSDVLRCHLAVFCAACLASVSQLAWL